MFFGRLIGWNLFFGGLVVLVQDALAWDDTLVWAPLRFGKLCYEISPSSLASVQFFVQVYLWPSLWDRVIVRLLECWAFAVLMAAGVVFVYLFRDRRPNVFRSLPRATPRPS